MNGPAPAFLTDGFARQINYLRVSVTDRCNLRCAYCMPEEGVTPLPHGAILSYEEILRVVRIAIGLGIRKVRVTGGEPLVRRGIVPFVGRLSAIEHLEDLSLTTNGILLAPAASELAAAGLRRVNVSLDTLRRERFLSITRRDGLADVLAGLKAAKAAGLNPVKVNVVAMRGVNDDEILDFAAFADREGYEVRFIEFMPSRQETWRADALVSAEEILGVLSSRYPLSPVGGGELSGPSRTFSLPGGGRVGVISPLSDHFCGRCNRLRLTADGKLRGCLFSSREIDLRTRLRDGSSDEAVAALLSQAVQEKPEGHLLGDPAEGKCGGLPMHRIGG